MQMLSTDLTIPFSCFRAKLLMMNVFRRCFIGAIAIVDVVFTCNYNGKMLLKCEMISSK